MIYGVGIDLTPVERIERVLARHGDRFERKVFTDEERAYCRARARPAEHFAARFAAKEALLKALGVPDGLSWHEIEVVVAAGGRPELILRGVAERAARARGVAAPAIHLSLTHAGGMAAAVVVAEAGDMIVVTASEMRALDEETIRQIGVPGAVLMESAGRGVVQVIQELFPSLLGLRAAVVAGAGNNGGDGFVVARHLRNHGAEVAIILCAPQERVTGDARIHLDAALRSGVPLHDGGESGFAACAPLLDDAQVIVDALLGTGVARTVAGHYAEVIARINAARGVRVAVDLPSGLDADRGHPLGSCVRADHTATFAFPKLGLVTSPGFTYAGRLHVVDIGIAALRAGAVRRLLLDEICMAPLHAPRPATGHKGTFGHALLIAGSRGHTGAALLCGEACARAGAGLVTIASPDAAQAALAARVVEVMTAPLGPEPLDGDAAWRALEPLLDGKRAIGFGPGVPRDAGTRRLLELLLARWDGPLVIDADGLNLLSQDLSPLDATAAQVVLTPHPAEMARLAGIATEEVQADRVAVAEAFALRHRCVVVLKGARTVVASDGRTAINPTGNPGMGTGGTGDVLTGMVSALLANGMAPFAAACAAVFWHGRAGDLARDERGEAGLLARDLIDALARARRSDAP